MAHIIYTYKGRVINLTSLAERLAKLEIPGASLSNLSRVFSGRHRPRLDLALAIAKVGGVPLNEIDKMLKHTAEQHKSWKYAPTWGQLLSPREKQARNFAPKVKDEEDPTTEE
jgi:hypothetical protein